MSASLGKRGMHSVLACTPAAGPPAGLQVIGLQPEEGHDNSALLQRSKQEAFESAQQRAEIWPPRLVLIS
ncbi:hypothetical protein ColTof3_10905 [Colletotrichum tofieldiae]|nr:hypothetical protein ColTof3_10905 [Colletotrichum tofieldiae]